MVVYKYYVDENYFEEINTPEKAYWLGFLYADGSIKEIGNNYRLDLGLSTIDKEWIDVFNNCISSNYPIYTQTTKINNKEFLQSRLCITSNKLCNDLIKLGIVPNKTYCDIFPEDIPDNFLHHYIIGVFDGDGCITGSKSKVQLQVTNNKRFCEWYKNKIHYLIGKSGGVSKYSDKDNVYRWRMGGIKQVKLFTNLIYNFSCLKLFRKKEKFINEGLIDDI